MKPPSCGRLLLPLLACASLAAAAPNLPMRVLLFTLSAGFKHGSVPVAEEVMTELGRSTRLFDTVVSQDVNDLSAANLAGYQAVFFYTTGNHPMTPELRAGLLDYVNTGGGFIGVHSATDTNYHWPEYADLIGAWFDGHPWTQTVRLKVEDREHPVTEHLDATMEIRDEIYQQRNWSRDKVQVLLSLDNASVNLQAPGVKRADQDFALAWCKEYGQGRVVYNGLGHFDEVWRDRRMQKMMLGAVKWVTRLDWRSDATMAALAQQRDAAGLAALVETLPEALRTEPIGALGSLKSEAAVKELANLTAPERLMDVRLEAIKALGKAGEPGLEPLKTVLHDSSPLVRASAVRAAGQLGILAAEAVVIAALADPLPQVRLAAVEALGGGSSPAARQALLDTLQGAETRLHKPALAALDPADPAVHAALLRLLDQPDEAHAEVLPAVVEKLAPQASRDEVFACLRAAAGRPGGATKAAVVRAVAGSGRPEAVALIGEWMFGPDNDLARAATQASATLPGFDVKGRLTPFVARWLAIGPFANDGGRSAHNKVYPPEQGIDPAASYDGKSGKVAWRVLEAKSGKLDFKAHFKPGDNVAGYAYTLIRAERAVDCQLRLGSDDGAKVWLNGKEILSRDVPRGLTIDEDRLPIHLNAGDNTLLVKVMQGAGDWSLAARLGKADGGLEGVNFVLPVPPG